MSAAKSDLVIEQGATFEFILTVKSAGVAIDVSAWTFRGKIKKVVTSGAEIESFNFEILDQVTNTGKVKVSLSATETAALPVEKLDGYVRTVTKFAYDIEGQTGSTVYRLLEGTASISPEVTR